MKFTNFKGILSQFSNFRFFGENSKNFNKIHTKFDETE